MLPNDYEFILEEMARCCMVFWQILYVVHGFYGKIRTKNSILRGPPILTLPTHKMIILLLYGIARKSLKNEISPTIHFIIHLYLPVGGQNHL